LALSFDGQATSIPAARPLKRAATSAGCCLQCDESFCFFSFGLSHTVAFPLPFYYPEPDEVVKTNFGLDHMDEDLRGFENLAGPGSALRVYRGRELW
jgi:hypothetical protein